MIMDNIGEHASVAPGEPERRQIEPARFHLGVVIRFKNSARTLPAVLDALRAQTLQPDFILGVDSGSSDGSPALLQAAGATIVQWIAPYQHSKVLNFALARCPAERVLVLSSHTVLLSTDALARLSAALDDPLTACASARWTPDDYYTNAITWPELQAKGLKFSTIYSNSFGLLRRSLWEELPFRETWPTGEDYVWAVEQVRRGQTCRFVEFEFSYQRQAHPRDFLFACCAFRLASQYGLRPYWLGVRGSLWEILHWGWRRLRQPATPDESEQFRIIRVHLLARLYWRFNHAETDD
ncbi:MAG: glycosyltransferase [Verrucomicrobiota bacterium]